MNRLRTSRSAGIRRRRTMLVLCAVALSPAGPAAGMELGLSVSFGGESATRFGAGLLRFVP